MESKQSFFHGLLISLHTARWTGNSEHFGKLMDMIGGYSYAHTNSNLWDDEVTCPNCPESENFHFNHDESKPNKPLIDVLCNECGKTFIYKDKSDLAYERLVKSYRELYNLDK
jgi:hypothetical protein